MSLFTVQACFSAAAIAFTMAMLWSGGNTSVYLPVLVSVVSCWLPSPVRNNPAAPAARDLEAGLVRS